MKTLEELIRGRQDELRGRPEDWIDRFSYWRRRIDWIAVVTISVLAFTVIALTTIAASAQQRTFYDASGRNVGTAATDSQGATTFRDAMGRTTGRSSTDSQGTTTLYDASGRVTGKATGGKR